MNEARERIGKTQRKPGDVSFGRLTGTVVGAKRGSALATIATEIEREHVAAQGAYRSALEHAVRCGELLIEAKAAVSHGGWGEWLAENFTASKRTAQGYMRLARAEDAQALAHLGIEGALRQLATPRSPAVHWALELIPPMDPDAYGVLKADIAERGCMVPIAYADDGALLDGRARLAICGELGVSPPSITYRGLDDSEKAEYVYSLNLIRGGFDDGRVLNYYEDRLEAARDDVGALERLIADADLLMPTAQRAALRAKRRYGELLAAEGDLAPNRHGG